MNHCKLFLKLLQDNVDVNILRMMAYDEVVQSKCGCCIGGMMLNVLAYADDLVLLAPSWRAFVAFAQLA